jgi:acetyl esterase
MALRPRLLRILNGGAVVIDGQTLAPDLHLMLRLQRATRLANTETLPVVEGRLAMRHHTALTGGDLPIGSTRDLVVGDGIPARLYVPTSAPSRGPLLVFFHGGGFMHGDLESHDAACRFLAEKSGVRVLAVDYRLGPEHTFPAAHDDAVAAYAWAVENADELGTTTDRIGVGGDSAGGNLAAGVAREAALRGWPCRVQLLIYPTTQAGRTTRSVELFATGFYLTRAYMDLADRSYMTPGTDPHDPRLSPLYNDVPAGLAPALLYTAGFDPLRDEGEAYATHLADAGAQIEHTRFPDQIHGYFNIVGVGRTSIQANTRTAEQLRSIMGSL